MIKEDIKIGARVKSLTDFCDVPKGTEGVIVSDYTTGIMIAWDKLDRPYPKDKTPEEVGTMFAINPKCPLRDGFDKQTELHFLQLV